MIELSRATARSSTFRLASADTRIDSISGAGWGFGRTTICAEPPMVLAPNERQNRGHRALESWVKPARTGKMPKPTSSQQFIELGNPDVLGLKALRPLHDVELDCLAFLKRTESVALDG